MTCKCRDWHQHGYAGVCCDLPKEGYRKGLTAALDVLDGVRPRGTVAEARDAILELRDGPEADNDTAGEGFKQKT